MTKYLINGSGVMIKPKSKAHMMQLLNKGGGWMTDPETGEPVQSGGGFRLATEEDVAFHLSKWKAQSKKMQQLDLQAKKQNAQLVLMSPDEATLERVLESREAHKAQLKAEAEAERAAEKLSREEDAESSSKKGRAKK